MAWQGYKNFPPIPASIRDYIPDFKFLFPLVSGPCTRDLNGPLEVQLSSQKLILLSQPRLHLVPLAKLIFTPGKGVISLASNKQMCIYIAIVEYEFIALAPIGKETEWIRNKMLEVE